MLWRLPLVVIRRRGMPYRTQVHIEPGAQAREQHVVVESDTAEALGTGEVPVLATSRVVAWCEAVTLTAIAAEVPAGSTSVAMRVHMDHIRSVAIGCPVTVVATLERLEGRRHVFSVSALANGDEEIASGVIVRVVVETEEFLARACGFAE